MNKLNFSILLLFLSLTTLMAKNTPTPPASARNRSTKAVFLGNENMKIDGVLDEKIWEKVNWSGGFYQQKPNDGAPETYKTEFCILYDDDYIYVGIKAHDPEPDKIKAILTRRDNYTESDWLYVSFDSYNDNRTAFEFGINAAGVKHDLKRFDDENADYNWDAIWDGNSKINENGWAAEWKIPFKELRFTSSDEMEWGFEVYRELPRHDNELSVWSYWAQSETGFVSNYGTLKGLKNIRSSKPVYFMPYLASQTNISENLVTPVHSQKHNFLYNLGGDFRYTTPGGITLNATINPDFGQIEADPADFNLTEFETYFSEKRPFFMEGGNILQFPLGFGDGNNGSNSLFYSRRIGRTPQGYAQVNENKEDIAIENPITTNILGAAKITGKTENGLSIGIMEAITSEEKSHIYYNDDTDEHSIIEPLTNYYLSRIQQDFNDGQATIGGIITAVNRNLDNTGIDYLHKSAYTGGLDFEYEFFDRKYSVQTSVAYSNVQGDTTAIQQTQRSSARYFQRTDADHLSFDPSLRELSGYSFKTIFIKDTGHIRGATGVTASSPGFEINDMGYLRSVDDINQFVWIQYVEWEPGKIFQSYRLNFNQWSSHTFNGEKKNFGGNVNMHFTFNNNWSYSLGINRNFGGMSPSMNRGGPALFLPKNFNVWTYIRTDQRKDINLRLMGFYFKNDDNVTSIGFRPSITWRPRQNLQFTTDINFNKLNDTWAWIGSATDNNGKEQYFWSSMIQKTFSITLRADLTITRNLSFQYYAQPYFTAGEYFDFNRVNDALNPNYNERFEQLNDDIYFDNENDEYVIDRNGDNTPDYTFSGQTDFNYKQFRSNFVLRWEYLTGSVAYFVWSQGFSNYETFKPFDLGNDLHTLFNGISDNVIMFKISQSINL